MFKKLILTLLFFMNSVIGNTEEIGKDKYLHLGVDDYIDKVIEEAEEKALHTCCVCGKNISERNGTLCDDCNKRIKS